MSGRKVFVGSLPHNVQAATLRVEFEKYGQVEDVFVKPNCEPGRQWAFVTFVSTEQAQEAKIACDRILHLDGSDKPCEVMVAKNQGMFGQPNEADTRAFGSLQMPSSDYAAPLAAYQGSQALHGHNAFPNQFAPKKVFVGSLPDGITETVLRAEFSKYGQITDCYLKTGSESGRNWAFLTFGTPDQAQNAKICCDRILVMPGSDRTCEVTFARHQGRYGQDPLAFTSGRQYPTQQHTAGPVASSQAMQYGAQMDFRLSALAAAQGPRKIFVGSLPDHITEALLRQAFSPYGTIIDVFVKTGCESGRQWAFITFASSEMAMQAKDATDRTLVIPGADRPCEVMMAKNQGKFGQDTDFSLPPPPGASASDDHLLAKLFRQDPLLGAQLGSDPFVGSQPPPPSAPPPAHLTPWRMYETAAGIPYYHNHASGVTQWECPLELQVPAPSYSNHAHSQSVRYSPY